MKHTKGPWKVELDQNLGVTIVHKEPALIGMDDFIVATAFENVPEQEKMANAQLIALAPQLWELVIKLNNLIVPGDGSLSPQAVRSLVNEAQNLVNQHIDKVGGQPTTPEFTDDLDCIMPPPKKG